MDNPSISISPPPNITIFNIFIHLPINTLVFKGSDKLQKKAETSITELPSACLSPKKINSSINHLFPNVVLFTAHAMNLYPMFAFFFETSSTGEKKHHFFTSLKVLIAKKKQILTFKMVKIKHCRNDTKISVASVLGGIPYKKASGAAVVRTNAFFPPFFTHRIHGMVDVYLYMYHKPSTK